ncbi:hypothetical protein DL96DRAFT_1578924 [Flagelloscypha sp. PMI_526]|nr:hypothetical protein DL96DRAFT_1578924 [Flagelloscypha sp. PMI_526]
MRLHQFHQPNLPLTSTSYSFILFLGRSMSTPKLQIQLNDQSLSLDEVDVTDSRGNVTANSPSSTLSNTSLTTQQTPLDELSLPSNIAHIGNTISSSPSSPVLEVPRKQLNLPRSQSVPRSATFENKSRRRNSEVDVLSVEADVVTKLRRWIHAFAIVEFDLDVGPIVDGVYPGMYLFPSETENLAFSAFPDSSQFQEGSEDHSFRIRQEASTFPSAGKRPVSNDGFLYCYSHFTQRKDKTSKRGYHQRALVILTHLQYPFLFTVLSKILGPLFEQHGTPMLETACHNIATWLDPTPGIALELGFLGSVLSVDIPLTEDTQQLVAQPKFDISTQVVAAASPFAPPPLLLFEAALSHMWSIWECLVLCEPLLIFGASPAETSQAVWWLRDVLKPIPLAGDFRPYFTIHDGDHSLLVNRLPPKPGILLGVTNPFFERSCAHWPHMLSVGRKVKLPESSATSTPTPVPSTLSKPAGPRPGWRTKTHNRYISKDKSLLKRIEEASSGTTKQKLEASIALRHHFCSRTNELLLPLSRYLNTLIPTPAEMKKDRSANTRRMKPFNRDQFFVSLKTHGSTLPFRSAARRKEFYERWLKTPAFGLWIARQEGIVHGVLENK